MYLRTKYEVSSTILTSFRQGVILRSHPKTKPIKSPPRFGLICEFHYDYIKSKYDNKSKPLFTDTDNLMYEIKTEDVYEDFKSDKEMFDFSNL